MATRSPHHTIRSLGLLAAALVALGALLLHPVSVHADDGCDASEPVACLPLPAPDLSPSAPVPAAGAASPAPNTAPAPARPCPQPARPPSLDDSSTTAAAASPLCSPYPGAIAAINRANVLYVRALHSLDTSHLSEVWGGDALADIVNQVDGLNSTGQYGTPQLLAISLEQVTFAPDAAVIRTREHWLYQQRRIDTGEVTVEQDQLVRNVYTLSWTGSGWLVVGDVVTLLNAPAPVPAVSVSVGTDNDHYPTGGTVRATITNNGATAVSGGGGYACGLLRIEWLGPNGWEKAPIPEPRIACPAIARVLNPGDSAVETVPAGTRAGTYRVAFPYSSSGGAGTAYSDPYTVQ